MKDFGLLYEDMEVRKNTSASNKIMENLCAILNTRFG